MPKNFMLSIVVPFYNESDNLPLLHDLLRPELKKHAPSYEIVLVNDGSQDNSLEVASRLAEQDESIRIIDLSRNFGKEIATTAGLHEAAGDAVIMMDADTQHPPRLIGEFIEKWQAGADVVVGVRESKDGESLIKRVLSPLYYKLINSISETEVVPSSTDYRLMDKAVVDAFKDFTEHNRITRGLLDWMGYRRSYVYFEQDLRAHGEASYSFKQLIKLAIDSFVSLSFLPLRFSLYLGLALIFTAGPAAVFMIVDKFLLEDPFGFSFSNSTALAITIIFFTGITLFNVGILGFYVSSINSETRNRPLYLIRSATERRGVKSGRLARRAAIKPVAKYPELRPQVEFADRLPTSRKK